YYPSSEPEREWGPPAGLLAIARDGDGQRIVGAPIEWSVARGRLLLSDDIPDSDVILVGDCRDAPRRPSWRGATVEATLGGLSTFAELEWVALPSDTTD